ncbi:MAG: phosphoribosylglycinamide formyltransferase [Candidatus Nanopelagicales bacterium]
MTKPKIVVLASGEGSLLQALIDQQSLLNYQIDLVISDNPQAKALERAAEAEIETRLILEKEFSDRASWQLALLETLIDHEPKLIVLAGFMRILPESVVKRFTNQILNSHPSLLPKYRGLAAVAQALAAGDSETGATLHLVDQGVDTGPIVEQVVVRVLPQDTNQELHQRIKLAEQALLPKIVHSLVTHGYQVHDGKVVINH